MSGLSSLSLFLYDWFVGKITVCVARGGGKTGVPAGVPIYRHFYRCKNTAQIYGYFVYM